MNVYFNFLLEEYGWWVVHRDQVRPGIQVLDDERGCFSVHIIPVQHPRTGPARH